MRLFVIVFMVLYLYALAFGIFMTESFRLPAPLLFGFPLILLFREGGKELVYSKELIAFSLALISYYVIGIGDYPSFFATLLNFILCLFFFNYFIGSNTARYNLSVFIFFILLGVSALVLVLNNYFVGVDGLRALLVDDVILQSPAGISTTQFTFGYQLAAFTPFLLIYTFLFRKPLFIRLLAFLTCLVLIYLGMQRSVFVTFAFSISLFLILAYRFKAVLLITIAVIFSIAFYNLVLKNDVNSRDNIVAKNINNDPEHNRSLLTAENLRIYSEYPLGLVFYGKTWGDVIYRNQVFSSGITSHNAYLMFMTYLGPFLSLGFLLFIYGGVFRIAYPALKEIRKRENALLLCLCFSFIAVSINASAHNAWLLSADGPTLFLYFSILHFDKLKPSTELNPALIYNR
ncbi:hypothetical protein [Daejeonella sp.]|uniref:hypothetical protein n=1 Tax=Daejeonella sp. TaxID=2805397 RepID=UPI0037BE3CE9